ncbi:hypothetical protein [Flammeovirga aprica]|uniref:Uncharacterized protein n=1 Tax=Flammeovirga aprica JL-4 TaxID=694437 RepID=A0A7X9RUX0_9BACT|nr:hypothetical protein [Flammeovirga aprica]NME69170.1 hypothetical protein [Flammeovirga aprica JL-4]
MASKNNHKKYFKVIFAIPILLVAILSIDQYLSPKLYTVGVISDILPSRGTKTLVIKILYSDKESIHFNSYPMDDDIKKGEFRIVEFVINDDNEIKYARIIFSDKLYGHSGYGKVWKSIEEITSSSQE